MRIALVALLFQTILPISLSSSQAVDSLRSVVKQTSQPALRIQALNDLAWALRHVDPMEAMTYAKEAEALSVERKDKSGLAWSLRNIHVILTVLGDFNGSIDPGWKSLKLFEELRDADGLAAMYTNIGLVRRELNDLVAARDMFLAALAQNPSDPYQRANVTLNLGMIYMEMRDWENALTHLNRSVVLFQGTEKEELSKSIAFYNIGQLYQERGQYATALEWYKKAYDIRVRENDTRRIANAAMSIGSILRKQGQYIDALEYLRRALELNKEVGVRKQIEETYHEIALTFAALGDYEQAYKAHTLFAIMKDSVMSDDKARDLRLSDMKHEVDFQKERNELLDESRRRGKTIAIVASAAFVLVLVFSFFLYSANKTKTRINEQLRSTQNQLVVQEKLASLGQLTAGIAHEIQNPLNFINNFALGSIELVDELVNTDAEADRLAILADLRQSVTKIHEHGSRADSIVRSMMLHARASSDNRQYTDLNTLLNDATKLASHGLRAEGSHCKPRFDMQLDTTLPVVSVVPQDIGRVFVNILNNAMDAVCERSSLYDGFEPLIQISSMVRNHNIEIRIRDNGIGVPENVRKRMFDPFFTTKDSGKGTGLGLSISYDIIVQKHGGTIEVDSREGEYTEFTITLPVVSAAIGV